MPKNFESSIFSDMKWSFVRPVLRPLAIHTSCMVANRSDRNITLWKFTQWVWCLFVSWQYSFSRSHPGPAQQEVKPARPSPLHISPAVRIMRQKTSHTLFILTRYKHWALHSAADDPSVSHSVFTITEKTPTIEPSPGWKHLLALSY